MSSGSADKKNQYLNGFATFFKNADFSSSYKPVLLKSIMDLADFAPDNRKIIGRQWLQSG